MAEIEHSMDTVATHLKLLVRYAMQAPPGAAIVEMGCGYYSTHVLAEICFGNELNFQVWYSNKEWKKRIQPATNVDWRHTDWKGWDPPKAFLTLLDNEQSVAERAEHLPLLLKRNHFVVVHDANHYYKRAGHALAIHMDRLEAWDYTNPHTAVLRGDL